MCWNGNEMMPKQFIISFTDRMKVAQQYWESIKRYSNTINKEFKKSKKEYNCVGWSHSTTWFSLRESNCGWVCQYYGKRNAEHKRTFQHQNDVNSGIKDRLRQWIVLSIIQNKKNRRLLIKDSRDTEDRINWCLKVNF